MNPNTSNSSATHARWRTRAATFCALACSVFWAGNAESAEWGENQIAATISMIHDIEGFLSQLAGQVGYNNDYRPTLMQVLESYEEQLRTTGTVTNFLGEVDFDEFRKLLASQFMTAIYENLPEWVNGWALDSGWFVYPGDQWPFIAVGVMPMNSSGSPVFEDDMAQTLGSFWAYDMKPDFEQWFAALAGSSNGVQTATTNLLTTQNVTLERVAEYVAGVSNAVGTISNEYETEPTGSNDLPSAETPDDLAVERSVDTSSLEEAVQQTFDGLDSLTPSGSSTVPEIMIRDAYRGEDAILVRLDLSEIGIATRICKACWAILLACGILGIVRSEWDYWTTLGGSAT